MSKRCSLFRAVILLVVFLAYVAAFTLVASVSTASAFSPQRFVEGARAQIDRTLFYDSSYTQIPYPMGDVPIIRGVCTDVVVRALRQQGIDLQRLVHEDMRKNFRLYPSSSLWGLKKPDANIDHRRVPNLRRYFEKPFKFLSTIF